MPHALEYAHVDAQLGDHYSSQHVIDAWNRPKTPMLFVARSELGVDTLMASLERAFDDEDVAT